jgi:hypothetical protein
MKHTIFIIKTFSATIVCSVMALYSFVFAASDVQLVKYYFEAPATQYKQSRLYAVFENKSTAKDFLGNAVVYCGSGAGKDVFGSPQVLSIFKGGQDGVFFDDVVSFGGDFVCTVSVTDTTGANVVSGSMSLSADYDTDKDGIPNSSDTDDDGDGISDIEEARLGTNPLLADTDGDGVNDKQDPFPFDKGEWVDSDGDGTKCW